MINYENDSTQNKHIVELQTRSHYESMIKESKKEPLRIFKTKPYYLGG